QRCLTPSQRGGGDAVTSSGDRSGRCTQTRTDHISTAAAPAPAGTYSQAVVHGDLVFLSGQTPRLRNGERILDAGFERQAVVTLRNLEEVARASGSSLSKALHVTVFLRDPKNASKFDDVYRQFVDGKPPARTLVQSSLTIGELEVNAIAARDTVDDIER